MTSTAIKINDTNSSQPALGYMSMPADFPYRNIFRKGRPLHERASSFRIRHPSMPCSKRAKIFAPFDALAGFDERITRKEVLYERKKQLSEGKKESLDRKLALLHQLAQKRKAMKEPAPEAVITYFAQCEDPENAEAYGTKGTYQTVHGPVFQIDPVISRTLTVGSTVLAMEDLADIICPDED